MTAETAPLKIVTVVGNPRAGSRTLAAALGLTDGVVSLLGEAVRVTVDLADIAVAARVRPGHIAELPVLVEPERGRRVEPGLSGEPDYVA